MTYDYSRAARERRQSVWQAGKDWLLDSDLLPRATVQMEMDGITEPYEQYLFLQGMADQLTAVGRDLAGLDRRSTPIEGSRKR